MNGLDWLIAAVVMLSVLLAAAQGFFFEIFSLAGVVLGYLLAAWEYPRVAAWLAPYAKSAWVADFVGFLAIFIAITVLAGLVGRLARWGFKEVGLRWMDRLLGAAFGLVRGFLIASVLVLAVASFAPGSQLLARSQMGCYLVVVARGASWLAPSQVRQQFRNGVETLRKMRLADDSGPAPSAEKKK